MDNSKILKDFFRGKTEKQLNKELTTACFESISEKVSSYIADICSLSVASFVDFISSQENSPILETIDIYQFSQLTDATVSVCKIITNQEGNTVTAFELGQLLQNDGKERKKEATRRYGADHANTASLLGLAYKNKHNYYLTAIGYAFDTMSDEDQAKFLTRLILRTKFMQKIIMENQTHAIDLPIMLYILEKSTYNRRSSSIKQVMKALEDSQEYDFTQMTQNINY